MSDHKYMDLNEFREFGYLQEVNRGFFHPLGLALEVVVDDATRKIVRLGGIWDCREDPEGITFAEGVLDPDKCQRIYDEKFKREDARYAALGYRIQPWPSGRALTEEAEDRKTV